LRREKRGGKVIVVAGGREKEAWVQRGGREKRGR